MDERIPPGQRVTTGFPVLHHGSLPSVEAAGLTVFGLVEEPLALDLNDLHALPLSRVTVDIHCVTGWSKLDTVWEGVASRIVWQLVRPGPQARFVMIHAAGGFTANLSVADFLRPDVLFAWRVDGAGLTPEHGFPLRLVVPHLYFWKSAKWVQGVEVMAQDRPGFWEKAGYHMRGDPWQPRNRYRDYPPGKDPWRV